MAITYDQVKSVASELYGSCLMKIPEDTKGALQRALDSETNEGARKILALMLRSAIAAETTRRHVAKMLATGQCVRAKGGVVVPTAIVEDPRRSEMLEINLVNLRRLVRGLRSAGIDLD